MLGFVNESSFKSGFAWGLASLDPSHPKGGFFIGWFLYNCIIQGVATRNTEFRFMATVRAILRGWPVSSVSGIATPCRSPPLCSNDGGGVLTITQSYTMKDPKFPKQVFAPTISPNELRERRRKMERALNEASQAIRTAKEEFTT
uniref:Uncharacterized protein n=1 Tax=Candidatus Kentrum sp. TUN TaxID=2126343 RepID=A0A450ZGR2_9GAMM|nr:MAG: hypothetical protein BECKTUN1418F_GA0071002_101520 [Candidatus Kentron sp. TUN]VFK53511.1 MAG: hypothetical protein BECKTUN1418E_GA0071001_101721 [Candidatus Kentron sp. TUN]